MAAGAPANASIQAHLERVERRVQDLVTELDELRGLLESGAVVLAHWQSYRLAVTLMRVDEAAASLVVDQARRAEDAQELERQAQAEESQLPGQLPAFPDLVDRSEA